VGTKKAKDGETVDFTVIRDVAVGGVLAIPRGATVHGVVTESKKAGDLGGSPVLALKLTSLDLGGQNYPLDSDQFKVKGPNKAGQTVGSAVGGGIIGTIIGCAVGRGVGCAVGAGAGVAAGTAASAASSGPGVWIPAEALVTFHVNTPLTVTPVSPQEAARMAQGLYQGGPSLYRRGYYPYGAGYYAGYPYGTITGGKARQTRKKNSGRSEGRDARFVPGRVGAAEGASSLVHSRSPGPGSSIMADIASSENCASAGMPTPWSRPEFGPCSAGEGSTRRA
jgi:hypothetical protein